MSHTASLHLRPATVADLAHISRWFTSAAAVRDWGGPLPSFPLDLDQLIEDIDFLAQPAFALCGDGRLLAFGQIRPRADYHHLARLVVAPDERGQGHGGRLVQALIDRYPKAKGFSLYVYRHNLAALRCYQRLGFAEALDPEPGPPGGDCLFMVRPSSPSSGR